MKDDEKEFTLNTVIFSIKYKNHERGKAKQKKMNVKWWFLKNIHNQPTQTTIYSTPWQWYMTDKQTNKVRIKRIRVMNRFLTWIMYFLLSCWVDLGRRVRITCIRAISKSKSALIFLLSLFQGVCETFDSSRIDGNGCTSFFSSFIHLL